MAAVAEDAVFEDLVLAGQHRAGRAERADGAVGEADDDRVGEIDRKLERLGQRRDADRPQPGQQEEQRGAVGHLGLALAAAGDLRIGIGAQARRVDRIAEHVAIGLGVAAIELADDRGELAGDVFDGADAAFGDRVAERRGPGGCSARDSRRSARPRAPRRAPASARASGGAMVIGFSRRRCRPCSSTARASGAWASMRHRDDRRVELGAVEHLRRRLAKTRSAGMSKRSAARARFSASGSAMPAITASGLA